jgi:hypothetical protein
VLGRWSYLAGLGLGLVSVPHLAIAAPNPDPPSLVADRIRPSRACPDDLETLMSLLLRDLPSYANRVSQRSFSGDRTTDRPGYILIAGRPEFEPLTLGPGVYTAGDPETNTPQVFFTTLERQYVRNTAVNLQQFHWLFLTETDESWRFVAMFSQVGDYPTDEPPSPPQDSSYGVVGQAIKLWLRDCRTGNVAIGSD